MVHLWFDRGTILLSGEVGTPYGKWDPRIGCYRIKAMHYKDVLAYIEESNIPYKDEVPKLPPLEGVESTVELRTYQNEALSRWRRARHERHFSFADCCWKNLHSVESY